MGRYNIFQSPVNCPKCQKTVWVAFQAPIGYLDWKDYELKDEVFTSVNPKPNLPIGPEPGVEEYNLWANGVGVCPACKRDIYVRIEIRSSRFDKLAIVEDPPASQIWEFLQKWGIL